MTNPPLDQTRGLNEQQAVISLPASSFALVTAGAGCGKTHVLAQRIIQLFQEQGLSPGSEVIILSFSRAAVGELRKRIDTVGSSAGYAPVLTFDSFATKLLSSIDPDGSWMSQGYDRRIELAIAMLSTEAATDALSTLQHVLIDELQDLVGPRAEMVRALLTFPLRGFTLFWDPAQSIYAHIDPDASSMTATALIAEIKARYPLQFLPLSENYRAKTAQSRSAAAFGVRLRISNPDYTSVRRDMDTFVLTLPPVGSLHAIAPMLISRKDIRTAILCRTNGQALLVSRQLVELRVPHRLQRDATDRAVVDWVGASLLGFQGTRISKSEMLLRLSTVPSKSSPLPVDQMWRLLKRLDNRRTDDLDLRILARHIQVRSVPDELFQDDDATVVVSTVHRAKGLEFDSAILLEPDPIDAASADFEEETRILYVALTRSRSQMFRMESPDTRGLYIDHGAGHRWCHRDRRHGNRLMGISLGSNDVDLGHLPDQVDTDASTNQRHICESIHTGDEVRLVRVSNPLTEDVRYSIQHGNVTIGVTSESFGNDLLRALRMDRQRIPSSLEGASVDCVETIVGEPAVACGVQIGAAGIWCRPRLRGLCKFASQSDSKNGGLS